jgi:hypothetical protein
MKPELKRKLARTLFAALWIAFVTTCVVGFTLFWSHNCT